MDQLQQEIDDLKTKSNDLSDKIERCVGWDDLNETFNQEIVDMDAEKTYSDERQKYPKYFNGLESISSLRDKLNKAINDLNATNQGLDYVKAKTGKCVFVCIWITRQLTNADTNINIDSSVNQGIVAQ